MKTMKTTWLLGIVAAVLGCTAEVFDAPEDEPTSEAVDAAGPFTGTRKLVLVAFKPSTGSLAHTPSHLFKRVWGGNAAPEDYSVVQYFTDVSGGNFTFGPATNAEGYTFDDPGESVDAEAGVASDDGSTVKTLKRAFWLLGSNIGTRFDANDNGTISDKELTLMVFTAGARAGATRNVTMTLPNGKTYSGSGSVVADDTAGHTYAHELNHTLEKNESGDLYGKPARTCLSAMMTLMSCSYSENSYFWFGLDPWWKNNNGWETRTEATKINLPRPAGAWTALISNTKYLKIINPDHTRQHLFLEFRSRTNAYDRDVAAQGVIAWFVHPQADGTINGVTSLINPAKSDKGVFTLAPTASCAIDPGDSSSRGQAGNLDSGNVYKLEGTWPDYGGSIGGYIAIGNRQNDGSIAITYTPSGTVNCESKTYTGPTVTINGTALPISRTSTSKQQYCVERGFPAASVADDWGGGPNRVVAYSANKGWHTLTGQSYSIYRSITCTR
jgi:M6 family metalloprotease-like protein